MATAKLIETQTQTKEAEIYQGPISRAKVDEMLEEFSIPKCLFLGLKADMIEEFGFNRSTGFFWLKQKAKTQRTLNKLRATACYDTLVSGFIEPRRLSKITGVKGKELFISLTTTEVLVGIPSAEKVKFVATAGIYRVYPIAAFEE